MTGQGVTGTGETTLLPWEQVTVGCGLTLHAPATLRLDPARLKAEFAALDAAIPDRARTHYGAQAGTGWTAIPLALPARQPGRGLELLPALDHMPLVRDLLGTPGWAVRSANLLRQPARGCLAWHYDNEALHLDCVRLLVPIHAPAGATTRIGHERAAYAEGQAWTGDFSFPHQVENATPADRVVLAVDMASTPTLRALFPPALSAEVDRRRALAAEAVNSLLGWWAAGNRSPGQA
ncbi:aspartyl/asparaginyl beta-hydroxylase domain-containing protein [Aerophototrophica crusticola]|uniref:Aspartyl/asparaginyl beta-hydroxylase domain-containing protein n=1 Tax=Aerophototrophica crusticola TaxID=1709002 RepID=A0A858R968_9PROT|nr:aspartyl/asparaginyl beta-hydroxylase domain-containing protein [Rhodospirillaceae bacterium B3]